MNLLNMLQLYKDLGVNGKKAADMIWKLNKAAFAEIQNQSVMDGFKAGYEAASKELRGKLANIDLSESVPEINLDELKEIMIAGLNNVDFNEFNELMRSMAESAKINLNTLQRSALTGMQQGFEDFVDSTEAGVKAKMAELREMDISRRDRKIAVMVAVAVITLVVSTVLLKKRYEKKKLIRQGAEKVKDSCESKEESKEESKQDKESDCGSGVCEEVGEAPEKVEEGSGCVESVEEAGAAETEGGEAPGEE